MHEVGDVIALVAGIIAVLTFVGAMIVSQIKLHIKMTAIETVLKQIKTNDFPHLDKKVGKMLGECIERGKLLVIHSERLKRLEDNCGGLCRRDRPRNNPEREKA